VLFCADHGEMLGERGLWYKMSFLEQSARVPLLVAPPGGAGRRIATPVSLVDFAATVLELAGLGADAVAGTGDGVSLAAALAGEDAPDHPVVSEYHAEGVQAPSAMIRSGAHKLIVSLEDPDLLYDLGEDPRELHDRSGDPDSGLVAAGLRQELQQRLDLPDIDRQVRRSQQERRLVSAALRQGRPTSWDFQPEFDAARQYIRNREDMYELQRRARLDSGTPQ
jgi:choline-sulfatase